MDDQQPMTTNEHQTNAILSNDTVNPISSTTATTATSTINAAANQKTPNPSLVVTPSLHSQQRQSPHDPIHNQQTHQSQPPTVTTATVTTTTTSAANTNATTTHHDLHNYPPIQSFSMDSSNVSDDLDLIDMEEESFYSQSENEHGDDNIWGLLSGVAGNIYEWYDFAVYGLLSSEIGACFFPQSDKKMQLIGSFGVFLAAFVMRPIGAILFGEIGDRLWGRKYALVMSIVLITVPSVLMGMLPTYDQIGISAPIVLVLLRMVQGLSVGGQLAGSYVVSIEQSTVKNRGFRGSVCDSSSVGGFLLASLVTTVVRNICTKDQVDAWAWRIPFWFSLVLAPILYHIVKKTEESKFWSERNEQKEMENIVREVEQKTDQMAVVDLFCSPFYRRQLLGMILVLSAMTSSFYTLMLWTPIYLSDLRGLMSQKEADFLNFCVVSIHIPLVILGGKLSDSFLHRSDLIKIGIPAIIAGAPVMFGMFECESKLGIFIAQIQFSGCMSLMHGGIAAWEVELWMPDPSLSFTGVAVGHNVASTVFGGTMPVILTYLFYYSDNLDENEENLYKRFIPGLFVSFLGIIALYSLGFIVRHPHDLRTGDKQLRNVKNLKKKITKKKRQRDLDGNWLSPVLSWGAESVGGDVRSGKEVYIPPMKT